MIESTFRASYHPVSFLLFFKPFFTLFTAILVTFNAILLAPFNLCSLVSGMYLHLLAALFLLFVILPLASFEANTCSLPFIQSPLGCRHLSTAFVEFPLSGSCYKYHQLSFLPVISFVVSANTASLLPVLALISLYSFMRADVPLLLLKFRHFCQHCFIATSACFDNFVFLYES